jgi:hypothetical protein
MVHLKLDGKQKIGIKCMSFKHPSLIEKYDIRTYTILNSIK